MKVFKYHTYISRIVSAIAFILLLLSFQNSYSQTVVTLTTADNTNLAGQWQVPLGVTSITVEAWGAGGDGSVSNNIASGDGGGGGGGAYTSIVFSGLNEDIFTFHVGVGSGEDSTFGSITAGGGAAGIEGPNGAGGIGGVATGGTTNYNGGNGAAGAASAGGGGGGSADDSGIGINASGTTGGAALPNGGAGGNSVTDAAGNGGTIPGGGGAGGSGRKKQGGAGAAGQIVITYTVAAPNNAPVVSVPATQTICEGSTLTLSNPPSVADSDGDTQQITITVTNGTLDLVNSGVTITNDGTANPGITRDANATLANIDAAFNGAVFTPSISSGTATIQIDADDGKGGTDSQSFDITVNPLPTATIAGPTPVDASTTGYVYSATAGADSYFWTVPSGWTITSNGGDNTTQQITVTSGTSGGNFTVYATTNGCDSPIDTYPVTVNGGNNAPVVSVPATQTVCEGSTLTLSNPPSVADSDGDTQQITITVTNGTLDLVNSGVTITNDGTATPGITRDANATLANIDAAFNGAVFTPSISSGTATIQIDADDGNGGSDSQSFDITVNPLPTATITGPTPVDASTPGYVYSATAGADSYFWTVPSGWTITSNGGDNTTQQITVTSGTSGGNITVYATTNGCDSPTDNFAVALNGGGGGEVVETFTTGGAHTIDIPAGATNIKIQLWGGGGHGGTSNKNSGAAGGGGGAYAESFFPSITAGTYNLYVGTVDDATYTNSWFDTSTSHYAANGESGGNGRQQGGGLSGAGGLAANSFGNVATYDGGAGADGESANPGYGGGGGSSAGSAANGNPGSGSTGGIAPAEGGNGGDESTDGAQPGGGGGGAPGQSTNNGLGGTGQVIITYTIPSSDDCPTSTSVAPGAIQNLCQGSPTNQLTATISTSGGDGTPTLQYQWYYNTSNSNTVAGATLIPGPEGTSQNYTPLTTAAEVGSRWYFCVGYATDNNCSQTNATQGLASNAVEVTVTAPPTTANAGTPQDITADNTTLAGNTALIGVGTWTLVSGTGTITDINNPTTAVTGLGLGANVFRWTISNAPCADSWDEVTITYTDTACNITSTGLSNVICSVGNPIDGDTYGDDSDDTFSFDINPTGANLVGTYKVSITGVNPDPGPFTYGTKQTFSDFLISDGDLTITIYDVDDPSCDITETVFAPPPCSTNHNFTECYSCHISHSSVGSSLTDVNGNALLCQSCHSSMEIAQGKSLVNGNKANPALGTGNSHSWDVPAANATYQVVAPDGATEMGKRLPGGNIICSTCHDQHKNGSAGAPYLRMDNTGDAMCKVCHSVRDVQRFSDGPTNKGSHPVGVFYDTADPKMDPTPGNTIIVGGNVECSSCHGLHDVQNNTLTTDGNLLRMDPDVNLCKDCHAYQDHNGYDCLTCHEVHNTVDGTIGNNIFMIRDNVDTPIGNKPVVFLAESGPNSFVDTDGTYDGICEVCHTTTLNHRADGSETLHEDSTDKREQNCVGCHFHSDRFATPSGPIDCVGCHSSAQPGGRGGVPQIVGTGGEFDTSLNSRHTAAGIGNDPAVEECEACHFEPNGDHPTTMMELRNDGADAVFDTSVNPTNNYCITCHDGASAYPVLFPNLTDPKYDKSIFSTQGGPHNYASGGAPTNNSCAVCHNRHGSANTSLLVNAANVDNCKLCHTAGQDASTMSIDTWTSGINSHAWDVNATNGTYDAAPPSQSPMSGRLEVANIVCSTCHDPHDNTDGKFLINNNPVDGLCKDCHSVRDKGTYAADNTNNRGHHPVGVVYPTATVNYQATPANLPLYTSGPDEYVECTSCHGMHPTATGNDGAGDGNLLRMTNDNTLCKDCHNYNAHQGFECLDCHDPHGGGTNIMLIKDQIDIDLTAGVDLRNVVFTNQGTSNGYPADPQALNSFADGDGTYDGICEVCHTTNPSNYHYNNSGGDHSHNRGKNCTSCHPHRENDAPNVSFPNGSCHSCHEEPGTPNQQYPLTGAHEAHAGPQYAFACSECHFGTDGYTQVGHSNGSVDVVFDPNGLASRFGQDLVSAAPSWGGADPSWDSGTKTCSNIYCHSTGQSADRGTDGTTPWSATLGSQQPTYASPVWTDAITACTSCHGGKGNMVAPYTIDNNSPAAHIIQDVVTEAPTSGLHGHKGMYNDSDADQTGPTGSGAVQCYMCHNTNNAPNNGTNYQGTYGSPTKLHVDGQTHFQLEYFSNGGTWADWQTDYLGHCVGKKNW